MNHNEKLSTMAMPKLMMNMSLPLMISLLVKSLYNIVDSIFVARIGEDALTAVSLAYPAQLLIVAVSVGTSVGVNALLSQSIGAKREDLTKNIATTGMLLSLAGMAVFMLLGLTCTGIFVDIFTDDQTIGNYCREYLTICLFFCAGTFIATMFQRFLQSVGDTFSSMISLVAGAVVNLILDPILIFGLFGLPAMEVRGAAIATVIGQFVSGVIAVILNTKKNPIVKVGLKGFHFEKSTLFKIYQVGLPTIVTQAMGSVMLTAVNGILISFSSTAVAFFGVYYKLQNFLFMPMNGMGQASITVGGYNYGAKRFDRIREMLKTMIPIAIIFALIISVIFYSIPSQLLQIFSASEEMLELGVPALRIISFSFAFGAFTIVTGYAMSGLGNGMINMLGMGLRHVVILVPSIWLLTRFLGVDYAWYGFWISEVTAAVFVALASWKELKKKGILEKQ